MSKIQKKHKRISSFTFVFLSLSISQFFSRCSTTFKIRQPIFDEIAVTIRCYVSITVGFIQFIRLIWVHFFSNSDQLLKHWGSKTLQNRLIKKKGAALLTDMLTFVGSEKKNVSSSSYWFCAHFGMTFVCQRTRNTKYETFKMRIASFFTESLGKKMWSLQFIADCNSFILVSCAIVTTSE